jgi:predicted transposase YbfD/YdcC
MVSNQDGRIFYGVASATPQGDMALQKSIADDKAIVELARVLTTYLDVVSLDYLSTEKAGDSGAREESVARQIEETAVKQVQEAVNQQIDTAISRQFKDTVSKKFKDDVAHQIKDNSVRNIRVAVGSQIDFLRQIEDAIAKELKEAVSHQLRNTGKVNAAGAKILNTWRDPKTNTYWSNAVLDLSAVKNTMADIADLNANLKQYFDNNADFVFDRAIREKNSTSYFSFK